MEISQLAGLGSMPFVIAGTELFKRNMPANWPQWGPVAFAFGLAEVFSEGVAYVMHTPDPVGAFIVGLVVWLSAMGAYSGGKTLAGK